MTEYDDNDDFDSAANWRIDRDAPAPPGGLKGYLYWWLESEQNHWRPHVDAAIGAIVVLSVVLIVVEVSYEPARPPLWVQWGNRICLGIFVVEYVARFWVNTDFVADVSESGVRTAVRRKVEWMVRPMPLIDLIAILPFGALRALRTFRFLRLARLLRVFKLARYSAGISGYIEELKKRSYEIVLLVLLTAGIIIIGAILIFTVEGTQNTRFNDFSDALWWSTVTLTTVGYGDVYPTSMQGRVVATVLMLTSIGLVSALGGVVTTTILERIQTVREGRVEQITLSDHIVFCGWPPSARKAAQTLEQLGVLDERRLVVITERNRPEQDYLLSLQGDFTKPATLRTVNITDASQVVIFHETGESIDTEMADRKTLVTALHVESLEPTVHTLTEVFDPQKLETVRRRIGGDEVVSKEELDAGLVLNAIEEPGEAPEIAYAVSHVADSGIRTLDPNDLWAPDDRPETVRDLERRILDERRSFTFLGFVDTSDEVHMNPSQEVSLESLDRLVVLGEVS